MSTNISLTPQERLALSRKAIVRHMVQDGRDERRDGRPAHDDGDDGDGGANESRGGGSWQVIKHALRAWWRHHPAKVAVDFAKPALGQYAQEQPLKLLGVAAATGAALVLLKPWRLVSVTGLLLSTLKSSQISGVLLSLLSSPGGGTEGNDAS